MDFVKTSSMDILERWDKNPFMTLKDVGFPCADVRNAGVVRIGDETFMVVSIETMRGYMQLHLARENGDGKIRFSKEPLILPSTEPDEQEHEANGLMDARITLLEDWYYIMYVADGHHGYRLGLARTKDFESVEHMGLISEPDTKGGALFPEKIRGRYARIARPGEGKSLWVSYSDDLKYWGGAECILSPRGGFWDANWVGVGCPPIPIERGWLLIYYGAKDTSAGPIYRLGAAMVERDDPTKILGRLNIPILTPRETYERIGDQPNIVFTTGSVFEDDGSLRIYYGAADSCIAIGTTTVDEIIANCIESEEAF